ncbi:Na+/H+ antiporter subunit G [Salipiger thiooxidans]|uniref:Na+/H+ antiporter subunit G n=1 Tax=Salipiger thiooxidans TaxID=282683 RepID=UPI001CD1B6DB|nr:Na+/H+ antiporter subunit G [Salipiger thiooxidans]MCA0851027.1 Na+/H+ antiporter subunit G [Salipiger thiooxidans]
MDHDLTLLPELLVSAFLVIGGLFGLVGSIGFLRLRDTMQRLHAPTKATTLGVGGVLIGSMLYFLMIEGRVSFHELLITLFLFLTAPITANFIAKTHMQAKLQKKDLPPSGGKYGWAVYDAPPGEENDPGR